MAYEIVHSIMNDKWAYIVCGQVYKCPHSGKGREDLSETLKKNVVHCFRATSFPFLMGNTAHAGETILEIVSSPDPSLADLRVAV